MRIQTHLTSALGLGIALSVLLGCGAVPASQPSEDANAPTTSMQPTAVTAQLQPESKAIETDAVAPKTTLAKESELELQSVEVGYKVGMQAPEFGISLIDGSALTSASLIDQGKPTFLYFHATW